MEARIHLEEPAPPNCAACYQAVPEKRHVDFGASTDGPMLPALKGVVGVVGHSVDEIVICETCITEAAKLLDLGNAEELFAEIAHLNEINDALHAQLTGQRASVTDALDSLKKQVTGETVPPHLPNSLLPLSTAKKRPARKKKVQA